MVVRETKGSSVEITGRSSGREVTARRTASVTSARFVKNVKIPRWLFDTADEMLEAIIPSQGKKAGPKAALPKADHLHLAQEIAVDLIETSYPATLLCSLVCELYRSGKGVEALDSLGKKTTHDVVGELAQNVELACGRAACNADLFIPTRVRDGQGRLQFERNPFAPELGQEIKKARFMMNKIAQVCGVVLRPDPATGHVLVARRAAGPVT